MKVLTTKTDKNGRPDREYDMVISDSLAEKIQLKSETMYAFVANLKINEFENDTGTRTDNAKTCDPDPLSGLRELEKQHGHFDGVNADEYVKDQRGGE